MTDWGYALETYKVTAHLWEVVAQSSVWPLVAVIVVVGLYLLFGNKIAAILAKFEKVDFISVGNTMMSWSNTEAQDLAKSVEPVMQPAAEPVTELEEPSGTPGLPTPANLILMFYKDLEDDISSVKVLMMSEQAIGNFKDFNNVLGMSNDDFISALFSKDEVYINIYQSVMAWKQIAEEKPELINDDAFKRAATGISMMRSSVMARERTIFTSLLQNYRNK